MIENQFLSPILNKISAKIFVFLLLLIAFSSNAVALNYNEISSSIAKSDFKDSKKPKILIDGIANFSAAVGNQSKNYSHQYLPDGVSRNYSNDNLSIGNDSQIFLKFGTNFKDKNKSENENDEENPEWSDHKIIGAIAKFEFNYNSNLRRENPNLDQSFLFGESKKFGRFEFGNYVAANQKMKVGPAQIARGAGGINGKYLEHVNFPSLGNSNSTNSICSGKFGNLACQNLKMPRFITLTQSPIGHGGYAKSFYRRGTDNNYPIGSYDYKAQNRSAFRAIKDDSYDGVEDATKLSYYSPRIEGFQAGLSYAFDSKSLGATKKTALDVDYLRLKNIFGFGVNYLQNFDNLEIKIAATGEHAKSKDYWVDQYSNFGFGSQISPIHFKRNNLNSYDISATVSYFGFSLSASYGSWGRSLMPKNGVYSCNYSAQLNLSSQNCSSEFAKPKSADYFSYGLSYEIGPIAASLTSIQSQFMSNRYNATSIGFDYRFSRNLTGYIEGTHYSFHINQPSALNITNQNAITNSQRQLSNNSGNVFLTGFYMIF